MERPSLNLMSKQRYGCTCENSGNGAWESFFAFAFEIPIRGKRYSTCTLLIMGMSEGCSVNFLMTDSVHDQWIRDCGGSPDTSLEEEIEHEAG